MNAPENCFETPNPADAPRWRQEARRLQALIDAGDVAALEPTARLYEDGRGVERDWSRAFELRRRGAEAGDANAQTGLARAFRFGLGVAPNVQAAFDWGVKALEQGAFDERPAALGLVGEILFDGEGVVERDRDRAFSFFWEARTGDDAAALEGLAVCYRDGIGVPQDAEAERAWLERAFEAALRRAELGSAVDASFVSFAFRDGRGVEPNPERAFAWSLRAAETGLGVALYDVGFALETGLGVERDERRAFEFYRRAADVENPDALCSLGLARLYGRSFSERRGEPLEITVDRDEALRLFERAAATGFSPAFYFLALSAWNGWGRNRNGDEALRFLRRSAAGGFATAQNELADQLRLAGGAQNEREATRWRFEAAERGDAQARLTLAREALDGLLDAERARACVRWLRSEAEDGSAEAAFLAARCASVGCGTPRDPVEELRRLEQAANGGFPEAQNELGLRFFNGRDGVERDVRRALELFGAAAQNGDAAATANLAFCCERGVGVKRNAACGEYLLRVAAELGDGSAAVELSDRLLERSGDERNRRFATFWLEAAAAGGDVEATRRLATRYWEGDGVPLDRRRALAAWTAAAQAGDDDALEELSRARLGLSVALLFCAKIRADERQIDAANLARRSKLDKNGALDARL
ncbi:MAG: sel1 repeat family protein [Thermoguttaceae bacterium]|nr:sel1 repeat family protein [Thermoguttaceae bacterium]